MKKLCRPPAPEWLEEKWEQWGRDWEKKYAKTGKSSGFSWRRNKNKGRKDLERRLSDMTRKHCSFCDAYPMGPRLKCTIEHFRPKTKFPRIAYLWDNLFLCCHLCQEKGDAFDEMLLKPDGKVYYFDEYFIINWIPASCGQTWQKTPKINNGRKLR